MRALLLLLATWIHPAEAREDSAFRVAWAEESAAFEAESQRDLGLLLRSPPDDLRLELLIAEASEARAASRFGHALLRLADGDGDPFNDLVLAFGARLDSPRVSAVRGILGGYEAVPMVRRLGWIYLDYVEEQGRALDRVPLPAAPEHLRALLAQLGGRAERGLGRYTFFRANCAGLLVDLLSAAGFPEPGRGGRIPVRLDEAYARAGVAPYPATRSAPPGELLRQVAAMLGIDEESLRLGEWPPGAAETLSTLSTADRLRLLHAAAAPPAERAALIAQLPPPAERPDAAEWTGFGELPADFYALCTEASCAARVRAQAEARFGAEALNARLAEAPAGDANPFERHVGLLREAAGPRTGP